MSYYEPSEEELRAEIEKLFDKAAMDRAFQVVATDAWLREMGFVPIQFPKPKEVAIERVN